MNSRSASIVGDQEAAGSSSYAWCNRQWLSSQALTRRSSVRPKQAVFNHNLLWLPESNGYPLCRNIFPIPVVLHVWQRVSSCCHLIPTPSEILYEAQDCSRATGCGRPRGGSGRSASREV